MMIRLFISLWILTVVSGASSSFSLTLSKQKIYIGESLYMTLRLDYDSVDRATKVEPKPISIPMAKVVSVSQRDDNSGQTYRYMLTPQHTGRFVIPPQQVGVAHKDRKIYRNIWQTLHTQTKSIEVLPLPDGIDIVGNYTISSSIDTNSTEINKPANLTVHIEGIGSLEGLAKLHLALPNQLVFESEPKIDTNITESSMMSSYTQTFSIVSDKSFSIPAIEFRYLNSDTGVVETLSTPSYYVTITNPLILEGYIIYVAILFLGVLLGVGATILLRPWLAHRAYRTPLQSRVRYAKTDRVLYKILLPYANRPNIVDILHKLEENIYHNAEHKIDRREVLKEVIEEA